MSFTVTATQGGSVATAGTSLDVVVLTNQSASQPGTVTGVAGVTPSAAITPTNSGSWVYGAILGLNGTYTAVADTTLRMNASEADGLQRVTLRSTSVTVAATPKTLGCTATANGISVSLVEINNGTGLVEDGSAPAAVFSLATSATTAAFTPPAGSLLVAMVATNGGAGVVTVTLTDTSGLGITWVEQRKQNASGGGYSGVWTGTMPGAAAAWAPFGTLRPGRTWNRRYARKATPIPSATQVDGALTIAAAATMGTVTADDYSANYSANYGSGLTTPAAVGSGMSAVAVGSLAASVTQNATAALTGAGALTASTAGTTSGTATLTGAGSITTPATQGATASIGGTGTLTSPATVGAPAAPTGAGSVTASVTERATAALVGAGALASPVVQQATATPTGAGALVASSGGGTSGTAALAGAGSLTAASTIRVPGAAALAGAGSLAATVTQTSGTTCAGAGVLVAAGALAGTAALTGAGVLVSPARLLAGAAMSGAGVLTGTAGLGAQGTANLAAVGVLAAVATTRITSRPNTGITGRPGSGVTARPNTGITPDPY
jgi:hypothetical protein